MDWIKKNRVYLLLLTVVLLAMSAVFQHLSNSFERFPLVVKNLEKQLEESSYNFYSFVNKDVVNKVVSNEFDYEDFEELKDIPFSLLVFDSKDILFWNRNKAELTRSELNKYDYGVSYDRLKNGYYMIIKTPKRSGEKAVDVVGLYLLKTDYGDYANKYLQNQKNNALAIPTNLNFSTKARLDTWKLKGLSSSLYVYIDTDKGWDANKIAIFILIGLCIILGVILLYSYALDLAIAGNPGQGFILLATSLICLRLLMYIFRLPPNIRSLKLFELGDNGLYFGSLGDLLVTIIFVYIAVFFLVQKVPLRIPFPVEYGRRQWVYTAIVAVVMFLSWVVCNLIYNVVYFSDASFSIVDLVQQDTVASFVIIFLGLYTLLLICRRLVIVAGNLGLTWQDRFKIALLLIIAFTVLHISIKITLITYIVIVWIFLFTLLTPQFYRAERGKLTVIYILIWIFFFSFFVSIFVNTTVAQREKDRRIELAKELIKQENITAELLLDEIGFNLMFDRIIKTHLSTPYLPASELKKRIKAKYFTEYFSKFDIDIHVFENDGQSFRAKNVYTKDYFDDRINRLGLKTKNAFLHSIENPQGGFSYIAKLRISDPKSNNKSGYVFIELKENETQETVYPELVIPDKYRSPAYVEDYTYAIYEKDTLRTVVGEYNYPEVRNILYKTSDKYKFFNLDNYSHLTYNADLSELKGANNYKSVIISKKEKTILESFSLFSYLFIFLILFVLLYFVFRAYLVDSRDKEKLKDLLFSSLRKRINTLLVIIVFVSLLTIGLITVIYFTNRSESDQRKQLQRIQKSVLSAFEYEWNMLDDSNYRPNVVKVVKDISEIHNIDVSFYDLNGKLVASSLPILFDKGVVSKRMDANAYMELQRNFQRQVTQEEYIGSLTYLAAYATARDDQGDPIGYIHVPYFATDKNVEVDISNFLVVLFNVYVLIMLLAVVAGVILSNSVTRSLDLIGEKIRQIRLGGTNERLDWPDNDEIGALVNQYNRAIGELENSVKMLAQAEREYAWQEMAKQVAHEIKNPLTPMKLSIQHLQRAQMENHPRLNELTSKVSKTLIEQIEHLTKIANEFSSFAQMPKPQEEYIELNEMLSNMLSLYEENGDDVKIVKSFSQDDAFVYTDRTQLNRVFLNIVKNALEAMEESPSKILTVQVKKKGPKVIISFTDTGKGITDEQREKIFVPNFTSKGGGMGLGLAISKNIIENAGGRIWFETKVGQGTTFFIELPLRD